jgi:hypothetical protein
MSFGFGFCFINLGNDLGGDLTRVRVIIFALFRGLIVL